MTRKFGLLIGFGAGYVLGARAGRQRYDQIVAKAQKVWHDPRVQEKAGRAADVAKERAGHATGVVKEKVRRESSGRHEPGTTSPGVSSTTPVPGTSAGSGGPQTGARLPDGRVVE